MAAVLARGQITEVWTRLTPNTQVASLLSSRAFAVRCAELTTGMLPPGEHENTAPGPAAELPQP